MLTTRETTNINSLSSLAMNPSLYRLLRARYRPPLDSISRRQFVAQSLAAASGLLLSGSTIYARRPGETGRRVIVIGAGFAGLACAYELHAAGYQTVVLEARDRIGGRVHTLTDLVPRKTVEAGGEFIGSNHPTWLAYAKSFQLPTVEIPEPRDLSSPVILDGKRLSKLGVIALFQQIEEIYGKITDAARPIDADAPWTAPNAQALDDLSMSAWLARQNINPTARRAIEAEFASYSGVPTERESFLGMLTCVKGGGLEKYWTENEVYRCVGGNQQLARRLAEKIGAEAIQLRSPVESVQVSKAAVKVTCQTGETLEPDDVVLAIPPSTWGAIRFEPPLPDVLHPQMGHNIKFLISLRDACWEKSDLPSSSMSDGPIGFTWSATAGQDGGPEQVLVAFAGAAAADDFSREKPDERDRQMKSEIASRYPGFEESFVRSQFIDWPGQKWTQGSYSTPAPGQVTRQGPILAQGLDRLHFAGEHACLKFVGFMEGALNSGATVARRIATRDGVVSS
jgi:monoamine oxidase